MGTSPRPFLTHRKHRTGKGAHPTIPWEAIMSRQLVLAALCAAFVAAEPSKKDDKPDPFVDRVVEFKLGPGGGYNEKELPDIVLGCPHGAGESLGSSHVF